MSSFSIVIPAKNEASAIGAAVAGAREAYPDAEIIVVDDGSDDDTGAVAKEAGANVVRHPESLGNGAAVAGKPVPGNPVCLQNCMISIRLPRLKPFKQGRAYVKTHVRVVIYHFNNIFFEVKNSGKGILGITLRSNPFIPVMIGPGRILPLKGVQPGIFPGRLIKMTVYTD